MSDLIQKMHQLALDVRKNSHSPYSGFKVGVCLLSKEGHFYAGCNMENAAYPDGLCAESCALGALVSAGDKEITDVLVVADSKALCAPCGGCRKKLSELSTSNTKIHLCDLKGLRKTLTMQELLPFSFSLHTMEK